MYTNTKKQGDAGLGHAIAHFTQMGLTVAIPLTDSQDYDLIVEIDGCLKKVQVKTGTTYSSNGKSPIIYASVSGGNKSGNFKIKGISEQDWDLVYCWHIVENKKYLIPKDKLSTNGQINLGIKYVEFLLE
jgi:hypothetical protein